ncbi:hypothetical protein [Deinococcus aquaedulcis]|uniref:hypothetical protein n=1 Tax=Deinococcus aquaedulcis TaxID=2840455 RepID=UPI001F38F72B|nr:hypothetical protein [Deinococcus aquaedulcis]
MSVTPWPTPTPTTEPNRSLAAPVLFAGAVSFLLAAAPPTTALVCLTGTMDELAFHLACEARRLGLDRETHETTLRTFATLVLEELVARGLLPDPAPEVGCWAQPRQRSN